MRVRLFPICNTSVSVLNSPIFFSMSGPNSSSEWSIEGRRLVPLMPRLVPQTAFTVTANAVANATANQNASLLLPAETGNKEGGTASIRLRFLKKQTNRLDVKCLMFDFLSAVVVCYSYTSTTYTSTSATATSGAAIGATVKTPRPPSPSSNVVVLPSGSTVYVKSECQQHQISLNFCSLSLWIEIRPETNSYKEML